MQAVILAGGLGTRLRSITQDLPKALVSVCGRPFIEYQIDLLRSQGIHDLLLCVGYLGQMIEEHLGDGTRFDVSIRYSYEGDRLLGTAGAIKKAEDLLADPFLVQYGDSYMPIDYSLVTNSFFEHDCLGLMVVCKNEDRWDRSNIIVEDGFVTLYDKWQKYPMMKHIDYGISVFRKAPFAALPTDQAIDLSTVVRHLISQRQLVAYETDQRFYEVGSPAGLREFEALAQSGKLEQ